MSGKKRQWHLQVRWIGDGWHWLLAVARQHRWCDLWRLPFVLAAVTCIFCVAVSPVVARLSEPTPMVQAQEDTSRSADDLVREARQRYEAGEYEEAAALWQEAASTYKTQGYLLNQAMALSNLSLTYQNLGQWMEATHTMEESLDLLPQPPKALEELPNWIENQGDRKMLKILAQTLDIHGKLLLEQGQAYKALKSWQQAGKIYEWLGEEPEAINRNQLNQTKALQDLGFYPRACETLLGLLGLEKNKCEISEEEWATIYNQPNSFLKFNSLYRLGDVLRRIGNLTLSETVLAASLDAARELQPSPDMGKVKLSLGNTARVRGNKAKERAARTTESTKDEAIAEREEAYRIALGYYLEAETFSESTSLKTQFQAQVNRLSLCLKEEDFDVERCPDVAALWSNSIKPQLESNRLPIELNFVNAEINLARTFIDLRKQKILGSYTPPNEFQFPEFDEIDEILKKIASNAHSLGNKITEAYAVGNRGKLYEQGDRVRQVERALEYTDLALRLTPTFTDSIEYRKVPEMVYQFSWQRGRILDKLSAPKVLRSSQNFEDAIDAYETAIKALKPIRHNLLALDTHPDEKFSFRDNVEPLYRSLIAALVRFRGSDPSPDKLKKAVYYIDELQVAELENFLQCNFKRKQEELEEQNKIEVLANSMFWKDSVETEIIYLNNKLDSILESHPDTAFIYPIKIEREIVVLFKKNNSRWKYFKKKYFRGELQESLEIAKEIMKQKGKLVPYSKEVNDEEGTEDEKKKLNYLYELLSFDLIEEYLDNIHTLMFVLDDFIRDFPLAILSDKHGEILLNKYATAFYPSLQLIQGKSEEQVQPNFLISGLNYGQNEQEIPDTFLNTKNNVDTSEKQKNEITQKCRRDSFEDITQQVVKQIDEIREVLTEQQINFTQVELVKSRLENKFENSRHTVLHLVTHGEFSSNPDETVILTNTDCYNIDELGNLFQRRTAFLDLLVLSACRTATGDDRAILGISGITIKSGAKSTVATLWSVDSGPKTKKLMRLFYEKWLSQSSENIGRRNGSANKAEALRQAQVTYKDEIPDDGPYYWAPFILVGSPF